MRTWEDWTSRNTVLARDESTFPWWDALEQAVVRRALETGYAVAVRAFGRRNRVMLFRSAGPDYEAILDVADGLAA